MDAAAKFCKLPLIYGLLTFAYTRTEGGPSWAATRVVGGARKLFNSASSLIFSVVIPGKVISACFQLGQIM